MILIGYGGNLPSFVGAPQATCARALERLAAEGVRSVTTSGWYETAPVPVSDQPWFINGAALVQTALDPVGLLALLHRIEAEFGRERGIKDAARTLDLDLLAYGAIQRAEAPILPHPRLHERAFVLAPLAEIAPRWRHPVSGLTATELLAGLPGAQAIRRL